MQPAIRSTSVVISLSFVIGVALATTCGVLGSPSFAKELPLALLWVPSAIGGVYIGSAFSKLRVAATIAASVPLVALGIVGFGGLLPYSRLPDPWAVLWGSYVTCLWGGVWVGKQWTNSNLTAR